MLGPDCGHHCGTKDGHEGHCSCSQCHNEERLILKCTGCGGILHGASKPRLVGILTCDTPNCPGNLEK